MHQTLGSALSTNSSPVLPPLPICHHLLNLKGSQIIALLCSEPHLPTTHIHTPPSSPLLCPRPHLHGPPCRSLNRDPWSHLKALDLPVALSPDMPMALSLPSFSSVLQDHLLSVGTPPVPSHQPLSRTLGHPQCHCSFPENVGLSSWQYQIVHPFISFTRNSHQPKPTLTDPSIMRLLSFAMFSSYFHQFIYQPFPSWAPSMWPACAIMDACLQMDLMCRDSETRSQRWARKQGAV